MEDPKFLNRTVVCLFKRGLIGGCAVGVLHGLLILVNLGITTRSGAPDLSLSLLSYPSYLLARALRVENSPVHSFYSGPCFPLIVNILLASLLTVVVTTVWQLGGKKNDEK